MQDVCTAPSGCRHCLGCLPIALTFELCDRTRRAQVNEPYQPWWPADIESPTRYFLLKRRAHAHLFREQARSGFSDPSTWRASFTSAAAGCPNALLARRGARQLSVCLPTSRTNVHTADGLEFVRCLSLEQPAAAAPVAQQQQQQALAPQRAPTPPLQAQQQQQQQQAGTKRPRAAWRAAPPPPATHQQQQAEAAAAAHQLQASMSLLASLQAQEHQHRQQFAAVAPAWATTTCFPAAHSHPAAGGSWRGGWGAQQHQHQLHQPWPYAVPRQGGWANGESAAALRAAVAF